MPGQNVCRRQGVVFEVESVVRPTTRTVENRIAFLEGKPVRRNLVQILGGMRLGGPQRLLGKTIMEKNYLGELTRSLVAKVVYLPNEKLKWLREEYGLSPSEAAMARRILLSGEK